MVLLMRYEENDGTPKKGTQFKAWVGSERFRGRGSKEEVIEFSV